MSIRTNAGAVAKVLANDYGNDPDGNPIDLLPYIEAASAVVDDMVTYATANTIIFSTARRELVERWLAAHYYTVMDPIYKRKKTEKAEGDFFDRSYLGVAKNLDPTGFLADLETGITAEAWWLGKPASEQTPYYMRD
jgi:hypothetical protein